jgi:ankyrin repeat protein
VARGAKVDNESKEGVTPLIAAAAAGHLEAIEW